MRILLVEDNRPLSDWLARTLRRDRFTVEQAFDGAAADHLLHTQRYDLVVLDLELPRMDGREVLQRLRARHLDVPVLILTAHNAIQERVAGLDRGADDFLAKPFEPPELEARIRALLRRSNQRGNPVLHCADLAYDSNTRQFTLDGRALALTPREHAVLETLMMKMGKTVGKQALADSMYSIDDSASNDAIEVYVHRLRRKLEGGRATIMTLRGLGYLLKERDAI